MCVPCIQWSCADLDSNKKTKIVRDGKGNDWLFFMPNYSTPLICRYLYTLDKEMPVISRGAVEQLSLPPSSSVMHFSQNCSLAPSPYVSPPAMIYRMLMGWKAIWRQLIGKIFMMFTYPIQGFNGMTTVTSFSWQRKKCKYIFTLTKWQSRLPRSFQAFLFFAEPTTATF